MLFRCGEGWVLAGDAAATSWDSPALAGSRRYYCADQALFDRHRLRQGTHESVVEVAMAPTTLVIASARDGVVHPVVAARSEEHTSELQSLMRTSNAVFFLHKNTHN